MFGIPREAFGWLALISVGTFVGSAVLLPWVLIRLPEDFLERSPQAATPWPRHPVLYWVGRFFKNLLGVLLLLAGILMIFTPGQGVLTILAGIWLIDIPGKRRWERRLIGRSKVLSSINWIRRKAGRPPLRFTKDKGSSLHDATGLVQHSQGDRRP